jgi:hypothetical protein
VGWVVADLGVRFRVGQPSPVEMEALADGLRLLEWQSSEPVGELPPRQGEDVIRAVLDGKEDEISILEWSNLFTEPEWPIIDGRPHDDVCFLIFRALVKRKPVTNLLLFRAALFLNGGAYFSDVMLSNIHQLSGTLAGSHALSLKLVINARESDFGSSAYEAIGQSVTPARLFANAGLGACRELIRNTVGAVIRLAYSPVFLECSPWFSELLKELIKSDQVMLIEAIASHGAGELGREEKLANDLKAYCDPSVEASLWSELSEGAQKVLSTALKIPEYFKIRELSKRLEEPEALGLPEMSETSQKNIRSRTLFWSNYQTSLLSVRVLLPEATAEYLKNRGTLSFWYELMSHGDIAEVMILEFEEVLIVDILRGPSTEIRLFRKSRRNIQLLQQGKIAAPEEIRRMYQDDEHDHLIAWQWSVESLLRTEYSIQVDEGITWFKSLSEQAGAYQRNTGLPKPGLDVLTQRNQALDIWWKRFLAQEAQLGKYGSDDSAGSQRVLTEARHYKRTGQKRLWRDALEDEARKGDTLSLILLVKDLLLSGRGSYEERIRGEHWLDKLKEKAKAGDMSAQKFLEKK